jgi:serine/threonine-protein kinase haspin
LNTAAAVQKGHLSVSHLLLACLQVAMALAVAEEAVAFEHRDLHWGNIMLSPATSTHISCRLTNCSIKMRTEGAVVCLIDFTASRLQTPWGDVAYCNLEHEEGLFDGPKGKCQFETYR